MFCPECGKKMARSDKFCSNCGTKIKKSVETVNLENENQNPEEDISLNIEDIKNGTEKGLEGTNIEKPIHSEAHISDRFKFIEVPPQTDNEVNKEEQKLERRILDIYDETKYKSTFGAVVYKLDVKDNKREETLRKLITKYFNKIPYHNYKNFGNLIKINKIIYIPSYKVTLTTFYNSRFLLDGALPHNPSEIIGKKEVTRENINIWAYNFNKPDDFSISTNDYIIMNSREVERCHSCYGRGDVTCGVCGGSGRLRCTRCNGKGHTKCWSCGGSGQKSEYVSGYGTGGGYTRYVNCSDCGGRGFKICTTCGGTGFNTCFNCGGDGRVTCETCFGTGEIVKFLYITNTYDNYIENKIINHSAINEKTKLLVKGIKPKLIAEIIENEIPSLIIDMIPNKNVKKTVINFCENTKNLEIIGTLNKDYKILKQKLTIEELPVTRLDYTFNSNNYTIWFYGEDLIYCEKSPISEIAESYVGKAKVHIEKKEYVKAYKLIEKASKMFPDNKDWKNMLKKTMDTIIKSYYYGGILGSIFFGFIFTFITNITCKFLFDENLYSALLNDYFVLFGRDGYMGFLFFNIILSVFIGIIISVIFHKNKGIKIENNNARFLLPFYFSSLPGFLIFILILFLCFMNFPVKDINILDKIKKYSFFKSGDIENLQTPQIINQKTSNAASDIQGNLTSQVKYNGSIEQKYVENFIRRKKYQYAIIMLENAKNKFEEKATIFKILGYCYFKKSEYNKAIINYNKYLEINPDDTKIRDWFNYYSKKFYYDNKSIPDPPEF